MTGTTEPLVSVLLLTRDGGRRLCAVLDAVARQEAPFPFEVVAIDSESRDGTVGRLRDAKVRVLTVPRAEFNHGETRNRGMDTCRGAFVVMLVQDAEPDTADWLARLVVPLLEDDSLAGSYARQVPTAGTGRVAVAYLSRYAAAAAHGRLQAIPDRNVYLALPACRRLELCTFDNVCSCIRRSAWRAHPFPRVPIAEDLAWAQEVLLAGYRLAYVPDARVRHLHDRPAGYELRRTYLVHQQLRRLFGLRTVPSLAHLARAVVVSLARHAGWVLSATVQAPATVAELPRATALAFALPLGQYLGARSADKGRELLRVRGV